MRLSPLLLIWTLALPVLSGADWIRIRSANFDLYTTSDEVEARQTLEIFEQARDFFLRVKPSPLTSQLPVTLVAFDNSRDYRPYSAREFTPAYFTGDEQGDYIVMSDPGHERRRVAVHEYVHLLVRHSGLSIPLWLNEGMAEVYSTMEVRDGKILLGTIPRDRAQALGRYNWLPLKTVINVGPDSPEYNESDRAGMFYGQSCLLVHMLMLGDRYSGKFSSFLDRVSAAGSSQVGFADVYGKSLAAIERETIAYFQQSTIGGAAYKSALQKVEIGSARTATELEIGPVLAKLVGLLGRYNEAMARLDRLSAAHGDHSDIAEARAYLQWQKGDREAARRSFEMALAKCASGWKTCWDYARLLASMNGDQQTRLQALRTVLERKPDLAEARVMLGRELFSARRYADALSELLQIRNLDPQQASAIYLTMAHAASELNRNDAARQYAEQAKKAARSPEETDRADGLLRAIQQNAAAAGAAQPSAPGSPNEADQDSQRPILRRGQARKPAVKTK